ncbi:MAG: efflux RND transporter periplasmic adaptor subunit [Rubripirellula sp.]
MSDTKRKNRSWGLKFVFLSALLGIIWIGVRTYSEAGTSQATSYKEVLTHTVGRQNLSVSINEQGTLESRENVEVKTKVRGDNTVIWVVENGAEVEKGEVLVRLDTLQIEDSINERSKYALWSLSGAESMRANAKRAALAVKEYEEGRFVIELKSLEKELAIAESNLRVARNIAQHAQQMFERGYVSEVELTEKQFAATQAELAVQEAETAIEVLKNYSKPQELERLVGAMKAAEAKRDSLNARAIMDGTRRDLALAEKELCTIRAPKDGMVIYPSARSWEKTPDVEEGATVHRDQTLLLMPDLKHMQVKVGIHESMIERVKLGLRATITLPEQQLVGAIEEVAAVAEPASWWTGNLVKYDTIVELPELEGLRPGMSAEVEVFLAEYPDVMTVPVTAVIESVDGTLCWVQLPTGEIQRRSLVLGDSDDVMIVVEAGLEVGERVILNPRGAVQDARDVSLLPVNQPEAAAGQSKNEAPASRPDSRTDQRASEDSPSKQAAGDVGGKSGP